MTSKNIFIVQPRTHIIWLIIACFVGNLSLLYAQDGGVDKSPASVTRTGTALLTTTGANALSLSYTETGDKVIKNIVTLRVVEEATAYIPDNFTVSLNIVVTYGATSAGPLNTLSKTLTVTYNKGEGTQYNAKNYLSFDGAGYVSVAVQSITPTNTTLSNNVNILDLIQLQNEMRVTRYYTLVTANIPTFVSQTAAPDELTVNWQVPVNTGENGTQLEWTWIENELQNAYLGTGGTIDYNLAFRNNATRIDLPVNKNTYTIPLLYDGAGKLYYRLRAVNNKANGTRADGTWSAVQSYTFNGHADSLNWQATTTYAEEGKRKSVVQYYDGTLRSRQTVTKDNVNNNTISGETFYDPLGRPAVQVLPVPGMDNVINYKHNLNLFNGQAVNEDPAKYFDLVAAALPSSATPGLHISNSAASNYYSKLNTSGEPNIPDAEEYPYTVTRYTPDGSGRILSQSGVGAAFKMGSGHETKYYYGTPAQEELDGLFGTEAGIFSHYFKNMVKDANGQMSVSYVDMHGRTVATALAGEAPVGITPLNLTATDYPNQAGTYITRNLLSNGTNTVKNNSVESVNSLLVPAATNYYFHYDLAPQALQLVSCPQLGSVALSYDCMYDLEISITDESGDTPPLLYKYNNVQATLDDSPGAPAFNSIDIMQRLEPGSYTIRKTLTLSDSTLKKYKDLYIAKGLCKTQQQLIDSVYAVMQTASGCNSSVAPPAVTCQSCMDSLGTYTVYRNKYIAGLSTIPAENVIKAAYSRDSASCKKLCITTSHRLELIRNMMLADMMPYTGQYAQENAPTSGAITMYTKYNIFSTSNGVITGPYYKAPADKDKVKKYYYDINDSIDINIHPDMLTPYSKLDTMSKSTFATAFTYSWANALLPYHPEYGRLKFAESNLVTAYDWIERFNLVNEYSRAVDSGFAFTATSFTGTPADPFFLLAGTDKAAMQNKISSTGYYNGSLWQAAYSSVVCKTELTDAGRQTCYTNATVMPSLAALTTEQKDAVWNNFKALYTSVRDSMVTTWLLSRPEAALTTAADLVTQKYTLRFATDAQLSQQNDWSSWYPATHGAAPAISIVDSAKKTYNSRCSSYIEQWKLQLQQCSAVMAMTAVLRDSFLNAVTTGMVAVCNKGIDDANPYGSSTVAPSTPNDGSPRSFEEVIKAKLVAFGVTPDLYCNPYTIDYPKPYSKGPVFTTSYTSLIDTCSCSRYSQLVQQATAAGYSAGSLTSLNQFLRVTYGDTLTPVIYAGMQHCSELVVNCSGCGSCRAAPVNCRDTVLTYVLSAPQPMPAFLKCGYVSSAACVTCSELGALKTEFSSYFGSPYSTAPNSGTSLDSAQSAHNALFARFLNFSTGFQYTWQEYAQAAKTAGCPFGGTLSGTASVICRSSKPLNDTTGVFVTESPCQRVLNMAVALGTSMYESRTELLLADFEAAYRARCLAVGGIEHFTASDTAKEYHYTLYYYDMAGNLVKTVPPKGVNPDFRKAFTDRIKASRAAGILDTPAHTFITRYCYNSLNQVVAQKTPDANVSKFWYDALGRLAVSRNAKQDAETPKKYSYTVYDDLGRITEVGQKPQSTEMSQTISQDATALTNWITVTGSTREQVTGTVYDLPAGEATIATYVIQKNLRNRVSYTYTRKLVTDAAVNTASYYTYDIHGNVDTLLQDYQGLGIAGGRFKRMTYQYDLISSKVNAVNYQAGMGAADSFFHRYHYDAENKLTDVETSRDKLVWERDAAYSYYKHGPLARTVLGQQQVQGMDYIYTLQGWLKGVNSNVSGSGCTVGSAPDNLVLTVRSGNMPAQYISRNSIVFDADFTSGTTDAFETIIDPNLTACQSGGSAGGLLSTGEASTIARDAFGFTLNYFPGDYRAKDGPAGATGILTALGSDAAPLYNGNIAAMAVAVPKLGDAKVYNYHYDQLNRLIRMETFNGLNTGTGVFTPVVTDDYKERVAYDPNGNIMSYLRNGFVSGSQTVAMDKLKYNYNANTNQLQYVMDSTGATSAYTTDLESQSAGNYVYDAIGNLTSDVQAGQTIHWTVYGKIDYIEKSSGNIYYTYDAAGNRIAKTVGGKTTVYVRDATGNVMSVYEKTDATAYQQVETHLYGSSRLGIQNKLTVATQAVALASGFTGGQLSTFTRGEKLFELSNHLGNVLATVSDRRVQVGSGSTLNYYTADVVSAQDYYPFGMLQPGRTFNASGYRYGFNGKENDNEVKGEGNSIDFGARIYDPRTGRWLSTDPLQQKFPYLSPYQFAANNPVFLIDPDGKVIRVHYMENGQNKYYIYKPGIKPSVSNDFVNKVHEAVSSVMKNDANKTFQNLSSSKETVTIQQIYTHDDAATANWNLTKNKAQDVTVFWNPTVALRTLDGGAFTPATALLHEGAHAERFITADTREKIDAVLRDQKRNGTDYDTDEERRVIDNIETPYIKKANEENGKDFRFYKPQQERSRANHRGTTYSSKGTTSIEPAREGVDVTGVGKRLYPEASQAKDNTNVVVPFKPGIR